MPITVRTEDGEMDYGTMEDVARALLVGLVDAKDLVRVVDASGGERWRPAHELIEMPPPRWKSAVGGVAVGLVVFAGWFVLVLPPLDPLHREEVILDMALGWPGSFSSAVGVLAMWLFRGEKHEGLPIGFI